MAQQKNKGFKLIDNEDEGGPKRPLAISNYIAVEEEGRPKKYAREISDIIGQIQVVTQGAIKNVNGSLVVEIDERLVDLNSPDRLFAYMALHHGATFQWASSEHLFSKGQLFEALKVDLASSFNIICNRPTYPEIPQAFYPKSAFSIGEPSGKLEELLDFFNPATDKDRSLIKAMFCSPFWGVEGGKKPLFVIDSMGDDNQKGVGVGKSRLIDSLAALVGCPIVDVEAKISQGELAKRLLGAKNEVIVRFDNVKSRGLSSSGLEMAITARDISGHRLHFGQAVIPNHFTYCMTVNNAALSKDLAKRAVRIHLARPTYSATWERDLRDFIDDNRPAIYGEIIEILRAETPDYEPSSRFGEWERDVAFSATGDCEIGDYIVGSQQGADFSEDQAAETRGAIEDFIGSLVIGGAFQDTHFGARETKYEGDPLLENWAIPYHRMRDVVEKSVGNKISTQAANRLIVDAKIPNLYKPEARIKMVRCWLWVGNPQKFGAYVLDPNDAKVVKVTPDDFLKSSAIATLIDNCTDGCG